MCGVLAAGALEVFTVDRQLPTYKRAAGALEVFTVESPATTLKGLTDRIPIVTRPDRSHLLVPSDRTTT